MSEQAIGIVIADDHEVVRAGFAALLGTQPDFRVLAVAADGAEAVRRSRELRPDVVLMDVRMPGTDGIEATRQLIGEAPVRSPDGAGGDVYRGPKVLILTTFDLDEYVFDALRAGASGFLLKDATAERLFDAVRVVAAGEALLAPGVTRRLISEFARLRPNDVHGGSVSGSGVSGSGVSGSGVSGSGVSGSGVSGSGVSAIRVSGSGDAGASGAGGRAGGMATLTPRETEVLRLVAEGLSNTEIARRLVVTEETVKTHVSRMLAKLGLRDRTQAVVAAYESGLVVPGR